MRQGWADRLARRRVPEPGGAVRAPGQYGLAVAAEGDICDPLCMGENRLELGIAALPGGKASPGGVLQTGPRVACRDGRAPTFDQPQQAQADLPLLTGVLAPLVVEGGDAEPRFLKPSVALVSSLGLIDREDRREDRHGHQRRRR